MGGYHGAALPGLLGRGFVRRAGRGDIRGGRAWMEICAMSGSSATAGPASSLRAGAVDPAARRELAALGVELFDERHTLEEDLTSLVTGDWNGGVLLELGRSI